MDLAIASTARVRPKRHKLETEMPTPQDRDLEAIDRLLGKNFRTTGSKLNGVCADRLNDLAVVLRWALFPEPGT